ncbi:type II secretion system F family protein [Caldinitratiruptor microaerophilus]|uniref:Secretion system protein n=1 Tax=Caldinitratiruptor microaerophilus TaxID=671077 RepID=A0AA35G8X2_9FIRM|nr:type II secretion system F family protein [Caldinitratiruptor microaerophilus]BDG60873.1 secretion system protein [Caldinitratiruptor microaerophilus]
MALYRYRARTPAGAVTRGTAEGPDEQSVVRRLREQGLYVVDLVRVSRGEDRGGNGALAAGLRRATPAGAASEPAPVQEPPARAPLWRQPVRLRPPRPLPLAVLAAFCRQAATALGAGVPVVTAIRLLAQQAEHRGLRGALEAVVQSVEQGSTLAEAFARQGPLFPALVVNMVEAGEMAGILDVTLSRLAEHLEKEDALNQKVRSATTYPKIVVGTGLALVVLLTTVVLPQFAAMFREMDTPLPLPTRILLGLSAGLRQYGYLVLGGLVAAYAALRAYGQTPAGRLRLHRLVLRTPIAGRLALLRGIARFSRTLGSLVGAGVPILTALDLVVRTVGNAALEEDVAAAREHVRLGGRLSTSLRQSRWFPPVVVQMVEVGEETGALDRMLDKVADFYERELDRLAERLTAALEPAIIIGLGGIVAVILLSVYLPMFEAFTKPPRLR